MSPSKEDIAQGYDAVADRIVMSEAFYRAVLGLRTDSEEGAAVLDLGCGQGRMLELLVEAGHSLVVGGDLSPELCRRARARLGSRIVRLDAERLPFAPESFGLVVMTEVLEHLLEPTSALAGIREVLAPGGCLLLSVPNRDWPRYERYQARHAAFQPVDDIWYRPAEVCAMVEAAGLVVELQGGYGSLFGGGLAQRALGAVLCTLRPAMHARRKRLLLRARRPLD